MDWGSFVQGFAAGSVPYILTDAVVVVILWPLRKWRRFLSNPKNLQKVLEFVGEE